MSQTVSHDTPNTRFYTTKICLVKTRSLAFYLNYPSDEVSKVIDIILDCKYFESVLSQTQSVMIHFLL